MAYENRSVLFEDCEIGFLNFSGRKDDFNPLGQRQFAIFLTPDQAEGMAQDGWNVKYLKVREEGETPQAYLQVTASYKKRPPLVGMVTSMHPEGQKLTEDTIEVLDHVDILNVDLIINPSRWEVNGKTGIKAYLKTIFVKIDEDYLLMKYQALGNSQTPPALEAGPDYDVIEGEVVEQQMISPY